MNQAICIIPNPLKIHQRPGSFQLEPGAGLSSPPQGAQAARLIQKLTGLSPTFSAAAIRLELDPSVSPEEAYVLDIDPNGVHLRASSAAGLFYGAQTLRQLLPSACEHVSPPTTLELPFVHIQDAPRFAHRGFMLDVSRHFFDITEIKRILDLLALHKLNRFHWHLTDDQGWRIEIKKYPRLTTVGAWRSHSQTAGWIFSKAQYDNLPHAGFYTQADIREVVAYAAQNFIEVIPEIGMPGHASAAMAAYPQLTCDGQPVDVRAAVTTFSNPVCVGQEFVFEFLKDVLAEVAELFPSAQIHIGGDEVNKKAWQKCPHCQERMQSEGLKTGQDLQVYFENRLVNILKAQGSRISAWNEVLHEKLDKDVVNQYWIFTGRKKTIAQIKKGRQTILSDFTSLYLDYSFYVTSLRRTYDYEPHLPELSDAEAANILGIEAPLWTEYVETRARLDWNLFPRLTAVSEVAWSARQRRSYPDFVKRLAQFEQRLNALGVAHATPECYLKYDKISIIPQLLKLFLVGEHPASAEYKRYPHPTPITTERTGAHGD